MIVVDVLGPIFCSAVTAAELVPDPWFEPLPGIFFGVLGATGFWPSAATRCTATFASSSRRMHAREPRDKVDLSPACNLGGVTPV